MPGKILKHGPRTESRDSQLPARRTPKFAALMGPGALAFGDYYNQMILRGLVNSVGRLGISFDVVISPTADRVQQDMEGCCRLEKYAGILTAGNAMQGPTAACASQFPNQRFALVDGSVDGLVNVMSYASNPREISFLCGQIAMSLWDSDATGCVLWSDNWVAREWIDSYVAGAKSVRPRASVYFSFAENQEDAHTKAALQFAKGVGIIMCHAGSSDLGAIRAASEKKRYALGFLDERKIDPDSVLFDVVRNLNPIILDAAKRMSAPKFDAGRLIKMGLKEGSFALDVANAHPKIGRAEKRMIGTLQRNIERGEFDATLRELNSPASGAARGGIQV